MEIETAVFTKDDIRLIVANANKHCYPGVDKGLHRLCDVCDWPAITPTVFADDVPILSSTNAAALTHTNYWNRADSQLLFNHRVYKYMGDLEGFNFAKHGLVLAGGFVTAVLTRSAHADYHFKDFDFFLVGHTSDAERAAVVSALGDFLAMSNRVFIKRSAGAVTFICNGGRKYQVILRGYSTIAEVLHGFDIAASATAFDGTTTWLTDIAVFALRTSCFPLRLEARRASLERRIVKYLVRGFSIILLDLDVDKFIADGELPFIKAICPLRVVTAHRTSHRTSHVVSTLEAVPRASGTKDAYTYENEDDGPDHSCLHVLSDIMTGKTDGLALFDIYSTGLDISSVGVPVNLLVSTFAAELDKALLEASNAFAADIFTGVRLLAYDASSIAAVVADVRSRIKTTVAGVSAIPYVFRRVEDDTLINSGERMSEHDWYGSVFAK